MQDIEQIRSKKEGYVNSPRTIMFNENTIGRVAAANLPFCRDTLCVVNSEMGDGLVDIGFLDRIEIHNLNTGEHSIIKSSVVRDVEAVWDSIISAVLTASSDYSAYDAGKQAANLLSIKNPNVFLTMREKFMLRYLIRDLNPEFQRGFMDKWEESYKRKTSEN